MQKDLYLVKPFLSKRKPDAMAQIQGSPDYAHIHGGVFFYQVDTGVLVVAEIVGLPDPEEPCSDPVFGFHIHSGSMCSGTQEDPFADTGGHYNPNDCPHPYHAGDLPPLFGVNGRTFSAVLTGRFTVPAIIGKTVIIHDSPDDFTTQPAGNAGTKIACGIIKWSGKAC